MVDSDAFITIATHLKQLIVDRSKQLQRNLSVDLKETVKEMLRDLCVPISNELQSFKTLNNDYYYQILSHKFS